VKAGVRRAERHVGHGQVGGRDAPVARARLQRLGEQRAGARALAGHRVAVGEHRRLVGRVRRVGGRGGELVDRVGEPPLRDAHEAERGVREAEARRHGERRLQRRRGGVVAPRGEVQLAEVVADHRRRRVEGEGAPHLGLASS
jgi:hypothetical protein